MPKKITFAKYLRLGLERNSFGETPEADFAEDVARDKKFEEKNFETWERLETYLVFYRACPEAIRAAKKLFKKWQAGQ